MMTEKDYIEQSDLAHRKKFGQFFTPDRIAEFMAEWLLTGIKDNATILEPAFGLGAFSRAMINLNPGINIIGFDVDQTIFSHAHENFIDSKNVVLKNTNYITASWSEKYDGIICNPPYLKFHDYDNSTLVPLVNCKLRTQLNGFTNLYTLFLLKSISQLKQGGRLAYIIPSEFLNSDYGVEVKRVLLESGVLRHIIIVDFTQCAFNDALTTACILLCEKSGDNEIVHFSVIDNLSDLSTGMAQSKIFSKNMLDPNVKWKQYYNSIQASNYNHLVPFSTFAKVSRGIATGANSYFTFRKSQITSLKLPKECFRACICHAADVKDLIFTSADFNVLAKSDKTVYLFDGKAAETDRQVVKYLEQGMKEGIDKKYLTASRSPWYAIENRPPSPIWVSVFNRNGLRFVRNEAGVHNLTTFHCVYNISEIDTDILFAYLLTDMAKEIFMDNSRQYGNGLVKFEPNDLNKGSVADLRLLSGREKEFILKASKHLGDPSPVREKIIGLLDDFFREKYSRTDIELDSYIIRLRKITDRKRIGKTSSATHTVHPSLFSEGSLTQFN